VVSVRESELDALMARLASGDREAGVRLREGR
jgi:hypothetical protein